MVDIAAQVGDFELGPPQSLAEETDFGRHHREFVGGGFAPGQNLRLVFAAGHPIEHVADVAKRAKNRHGKQERQQDGAGHGQYRYFHLFIQRVPERRADQGGVDDHAHVEDCGSAGTHCVLQHVVTLALVQKSV